ncbi:glycogen(starch) synthase [Actinomadura pelletieri DSM 43383]|uniref:Glycogen(Starch) synthase n=1 Tax=Actinomadura pelletieri DSM 43383 TaxID=1120940 RepID=A0A495QA41_9ACTN|nr:glycosyltransferase [Actinomadura pelletieri]RKS68388.1 glycogen(starch) synthase [Actinomadura pelletieri DSM 43383]
MAHDRDVAVVTPWYPSPPQPFLGAFVQAMVEATAPGCGDVTVYHTDAWPARMKKAAADKADAAHRSLFPAALHRGKTVGGADLLRVPVLTPRGSFDQVAQRHSLWLREALGGEPIPAPVVHAHVGLRGGWPALENARPDARVFITEHASYIDKVLAHDGCRDMYGQILERCTTFFAVTDALRDKLVATFPSLADKIEIISNPISFEVPRPEPVTELRRWLYVGGLIERKGVEWLLEAFAKCHADDPELTLTIVGDGPLEDTLTTRAAELQVDHALTMLGAVTPDVATRLMREHDLLVHPSRWETFGVTVVEAVAAGMPVLVTRCGGPEHTLAGIEDAAGQMIDVEENAESIVAGYRRLRDRFPHGLDLDRAQRTLDERYGYRAVAEAHYRHWFPDGGHEA